MQYKFLMYFLVDRSQLGKNINTDEAAALGMCTYVCDCVNAF